MSHDTYNKLWCQAQEIVDDATRTDVDQQSAKPLKDKRLAHRIVGDLFIKYTRAINLLDQCYDQVVQPQKRQLLRRLLDLSLGRYLELKHEMVELHLSEFSYFDDLLTEQRILPSEAQVNIPNYYRRERAQEIAYRRRTMDNILKKLGFYEEEFTGIEMTEDEAIRLIQIHERARQGRLRSQFMKEIRLLKEKVKVEPPAEDRKEEINRRAALLIQKLWRGYVTRRKVRKRTQDEMLLIGMLPPSQNVTVERQRADHVKELRRQLQDQYYQDFQAAIIKEKEQGSAREILQGVRERICQALANLNEMEMRVSEPQKQFLHSNSPISVNSTQFQTSNLISPQSATENERQAPEMNNTPTSDANGWFNEEEMAGNSEYGNVDDLEHSVYPEESSTLPGPAECRRFPPDLQCNPSQLNMYAGHYFDTFPLATSSPLSKSPPSSPFPKQGSPCQPFSSPFTDEIFQSPNDIHQRASPEEPTSVQVQMSHSQLKFKSPDNTEVPRLFEQTTITSEFPMNEPISQKFGNQLPVRIENTNSQYPVHHACSPPEEKQRLPESNTDYPYYGDINISKEGNSECGIPKPNQSPEQIRYDPNNQVPRFPRVFEAENKIVPRRAVSPKNWKNIPISVSTDNLAQVSVSLQDLYVEPAPPHNTTRHSGEISPLTPRSVKSKSSDRKPPHRWEMSASKPYRHISKKNKSCGICPLCKEQSRSKSNTQFQAPTTDQRGAGIYPRALQTSQSSLDIHLTSSKTQSKNEIGPSACKDQPLQERSHHVSLSFEADRGLVYPKSSFRNLQTRLGIKNPSPRSDDVRNHSSYPKTIPSEINIDISKSNKDYVRSEVCPPSSDRHKYPSSTTRPQGVCKALASTQGQRVCTVPPSVIGNKSATEIRPTSYLRSIRSPRLDPRSKEFHVQDSNRVEESRVNLRNQILCHNDRSTVVKVVTDCASPLSKKYNNLYYVSSEIQDEFERSIDKFNMSLMKLTNLIQKQRPI